MLAFTLPVKWMEAMIWSIIIGNITVGIAICYREMKDFDLTNLMIIIKVIKITAFY